MATAKSTTATAPKPRTRKATAAAATDAAERAVVARLDSDKVATPPEPEWDDDLPIDPEGKGTAAVQALADAGQLVILPTTPKKKTTAREPKPAKPARKALEPITRHLWRETRADRIAICREFVGHFVRVEAWLGRVAADGDRTYVGKVLTVAFTTTGTTADFLILQGRPTDFEGEGSWAISTAQIAYLELDKKRDDA